MIPPKKRKEMGIIIRKAREAKKMTQPILASKLGQPYVLIGRLERGDFAALNQAMMDKLCEILEIEL